MKIGKYEQGEVLNTVTKHLVREKNIQTKNIYTVTDSLFPTSRTNIYLIIRERKGKRK